MTYTNNPQGDRTRGTQATGYGLEPSAVSSAVNESPADREDAGHTPRPGVRGGR
ncbi:hypothetical protein ACFV2U_46065 [Streptomyces sp. NPDC059697]|uniref:hypothetical protein n=1 Tax=Streptomyces sp. NPDC059697 TaxID=3346912 RepID=UPI0036A832A9